MTPQEQAVRLIVIKVLRDHVLKVADDDARNEIRATWMTGDRLNGALAGRPAGQVQLKNGTTGAAVTDRQAFEEWVREHRGEEWETFVPRPVARVRPAFESAVLALAKKQGVAVTAGGEEIPGITVSEGAPTPAVSLADDAAELVTAAWQSGELWEIVGSLLPALDAAPAGGEA